MGIEHRCTCLLQGGRGTYGGPTLAGVPGERAFSVAGPERDWGIVVATPRPGDPARWPICFDTPSLNPTCPLRHPLDPLGLVLDCYINSRSFQAVEVMRQPIVCCVTYQAAGRRREEGRQSRRHAPAPVPAGRLRRQPDALPVDAHQPA